MTTDLLETHPKQAIHDQLESESAIMLEIEGVTDFMIPMAAKPDQETNTVWFFADRSSEIFSKFTSPSKARIIISSNKDKFWADIQGEIKESTNEEVIANKWSADVEAWYDKGKDDENLMLLAFVPKTAHASSSTTNPIKFSWQTAKAILNKQETPSISIQKSIDYA
ncbi:MAG: pyridoxamine 5'-phosphate oxidase family protein [Oleibacter sp.]|nr:pyridoxamine 5'-phosphate oxidase family protein [Thalassolituus sp.]